MELLREIVISGIVTGVLIVLIMLIFVATLIAIREYKKISVKEKCYRDVYYKAIEDARYSVNRMYDDWEADDPLADIPDRRTINSRLDILKNNWRKNI